MPSGLRRLLDGWQERKLSWPQAVLLNPETQGPGERVERTGRGRAERLSPILVSGESPEKNSVRNWDKVSPRPAVHSSAL